MEEMRQQIAILKEKLAKQEIVNEKIILKTMKEKMTSINKDKMKMRVLNVFALVFCTFVFAMAGLPIWFLIATVVLLGYSLLAHEWAYKDIDNNLSEQNLMEVRQNALHVKTTNAKTLKIGFILCAIWLGALIFAEYQRGDYHQEFIGYIAIMYCVAAIVGGLIGYGMYRRQQRHVKELIDEIDSYKETER